MMENPDSVTVSHSLDIGRCFKEALNIYKKNIIILVFSAFLFQIISIFSLFILTGPLNGGYCLMMLNAMRKKNKKVKLADMFKMFNKLLPLLGLFYIEAILIFIGSMLLIIPGLLLAAMWLYAFFVMVDKDETIIQSLKTSWDIVRLKGFWVNLTLFIIYFILSALPAQIPYIGWILSFFVSPFVVLMLASAYIQQTQEDKGGSDEPFPATV